MFLADNLLLYGVSDVLGGFNVAGLSVGFNAAVVEQVNFTGMAVFKTVFTTMPQLSAIQKPSNYIKHYVMDHGCSKNRTL